MKLSQSIGDILQQPSCRNSVAFLAITSSTGDDNSDEISDSFVVVELDLSVFAVITIGARVMLPSAGRVSRAADGTEKGACISGTSLRNCLAGRVYGDAILVSMRVEL
jgi:hypothetical protein